MLFLTLPHIQTELSMILWEMNSFQHSRTNSEMENSKEHTDKRTLDSEHQPKIKEEKKRKEIYRC